MTLRYDKIRMIERLYPHNVENIVKLVLLFYIGLS